MVSFQSRMLTSRDEQKSNSKDRESVGENMGWLCRVMTSVSVCVSKREAEDNKEQKKKKDTHS